MDTPLITIEIVDCQPAVASLVIALNIAQIPCKVVIESFGADRTLTIVKLYGGH